MESDVKQQHNPVTTSNLNKEIQCVEENPQGPSPHYFRERHQEPVRINADDQSQCKIFMYAVAVIVPLIFLVIISAFVLPQATKSVDPKQSLAGSNLKNCPGIVECASLSTNYLSCYTRTTFLAGTANSMGIFVKLFSRLNQFMLFYIDLTPFAKQRANKNELFRENITFTVYSTQYKTKTNYIKVIRQLHSNNLTIDTSIAKLADKKYFLGYQPKISSGEQYFVQVAFQNNSAITNSSAFSLNVEKVEESFTIYTILLRVSFFVVTLIVFIKYTMNCLKIPRKKLSIQQKGVQILGALTLLFNDQLYFVTVLWPNAFSSFLSALFIWSYLFGLFVLWCSFLLRIIHEEADTDTVQLKNPLRITLFVLFFIIGLTVCAGYGIIQAGQYPMISINAINYTWFKVYMAAIFICLIMAFFYLFYLYCRICQYRPMRAHRHSVFMYISLFFIIVIIVASLAGSFQVYNFSGALILFAFAFNNFYTYFLMYLYSPIKEQIQKYKQGEYLESQGEILQQVNKTVNIQLLEIESDIQNDQNSIKFDFENSNNSQKSQNKQEHIDIYKYKKEQAKKRPSFDDQENLGESHSKILKEQQQEYEKQQCKSQISIEQQCQRHDI